MHSDIYNNNICCTTGGFAKVKAATHKLTGEKVRIYLFLINWTAPLLGHKQPVYYDHGRHTVTHIHMYHHRDRVVLVYSLISK